MLVCCMNTEIKIGQVYLEDVGAGQPKNRLKVSYVTESYVNYSFGDREHIKARLARNRFEACIRDGAFSLMHDASLDLRAENDRLKQAVQNLSDRLNHERLEAGLQFARERAELNCCRKELNVAQDAFNRELHRRETAEKELCKLREKIKELLPFGIVPA